MSGILRRGAEDPGDALRGQFGLRQESGGRAFGDQLGVVCFGRCRDQDHVGAGPVARLIPLTVLGEEPGQVKAALLAEPDVDEDDVRLQRAGLPERLGDAGGHAHDGHALSPEQDAGGLEEGLVVIN